MNRNVTPPTAHLVVDLSYGDAGKGTTTDWLARTRPVHTVVRMNGGGQAAHNVVTSDGRHHTCSQFGSAVFVPGVRTYLSRHFLFEPLALMAEARRLAANGVPDALSRLAVSADALVVTPFHRAVNHLREYARGDARHGSCGLGIGEAAADALVIGPEAVRVGDLRGDRAALERKLRRLQARKRAELADLMATGLATGRGAEDVDILSAADVTEAYLGLVADVVPKIRIVADDYLTAILREPGDVVFEGAQGVLIDEWRGFHPYTTWSTCTFANALDLLAAHRYDGRVVRLGVVRAYATRHGPGPFVTEDAALTAALPDRHNRQDGWQGRFRVGWFDAVATRYAIAACGGVDGLAVTGLDRLAELTDWHLADAYRLAAPSPRFRPSADDPTEVADIRLGPFRDLAYQEAVTNDLQRARPELTVTAATGDFENRATAHLAAIAAAIGAPVAVASFGPTAGDKRSF